MVIFSWQAILERLPTRRNLAKRGASLLDGQDGCPFCNHNFESKDHLFLLCPYAWNIWMEVYKWFGLLDVLVNSFENLFLIKLLWGL
jgi:hypothetical protein